MELSLPFRSSLVLEPPGEADLESLPLTPTAHPRGPTASVTLHHHTPRKLRGANTLQRSTLSWGSKALLLLETCCDGGVPMQHLVSSTALAASAQWVPSNPKDSEMTPSGDLPWELRNSPWLPQNPPLPRLSLRASMWEQAPSPCRPSSFPGSSSLSPPSSFWPAALPVCQTAQRHLSPDRGHGWGRSCGPCYIISLYFNHRWESKSPNIIFNTRNC